MKEIHFYSSKIKSLILFIISLGFCLLFIRSYDKLENEILYKVIISHFGFLLFFFGFIYSMFLLLRRKPLLSITHAEIIIHHLVRKSDSVKFEEISKFYVSNTTFRGLKTNEHIYVVMKHPKASSKKTSSFYGVEHIIKTDILNVKTSELLKILNKKLESYQ